MSRIVRRDMLKVLAATAAGAAVSGSAIESALAASTPNPNPSGLRTGVAAPKVRFTTNAGLSYTWLWGPTDFTTSSSAQAWADQYVSGNYSVQPGGTMWARADVPDGAVLTELWASLIVNDGNSALIQFAQIFPWANSAPLLGSGVVSTPQATVQNVLITIPPTLADKSQSSFILVYLPGTLNSATHQLFGMRLGWTLNPGLTLFPDPRRIIGGSFVNGATTGPYDATLKSDLVTPTGIPVGAKAAFCAVQSYTPGVLTLFPDLATDPGIANYSGTGTQGFGLNMVYMMVPLSTAGKFKIHSYISGNCYVDAWGYVV